MQNLRVQEALYKLHGWHNNGLWCWHIRSRSLPDHYREDCSCYARECNLFVPRCWVFTYSGKESRRRICRWRGGELQVDSVMHVASIILRTQCFNPETGTLAPSPSDTWIYYKV